MVKTWRTAAIPVYYFSCIVAEWCVVPLKIVLYGGLMYSEIRL